MKEEKLLLTISPDFIGFKIGGFESVEEARSYLQAIEKVRGGEIKALESPEVVDMRDLLEKQKCNCELLMSKCSRCAYLENYDKKLSELKGKSHE